MFPAQARRPQQQHQQHPPAAGRASEAAQAEGTRHPLDGEQQHGEHWEDSHISASSPPSLAAPLPSDPVSASSSSSEPSTQCWICYEDASESSRPLVHVCSCTLSSHPDCLLHWLESQTTAPHCPVCNASIGIHEDKSEVLRLYRKFRSKMDTASLAAAVGGVGASCWFVSAAYGAWVVKAFMGEQVAQALLLRHDGGIPWRYWLNLPLIPFTLILSRTPLIDSLLPFLPLTLVLSTHSAHRPLSHLPLFDPLGLDDLTFRYPPSPTLTVCLLPWLRLFYLRARVRVFKAVLGRGKKYRGLAGVFEEAAENDFAAAAEGNGAEGGGGGDGTQQHREPVELVATIEVEVEDRPTAAPAPTAQQGGTVDPAAAPQPLPISARLRIGLGRLTSLVLGALLFPFLSSLAGSALLFLASRGSLTSPSRPLALLRKLLGVSALVAASRGSGGGGGGMGTGWSRQVLALGQGAGRRSFLNLGGESSIVDPVWVRNTIGAGIVLLVRDAVELTAGVLENRRKASRRVVERPFAPEKLAASSSAGSTRSATPSSGAAVVMTSGGTDENGREAVVHTLL